MSMVVTYTEFKELLILQPRLHTDSRGYFMEAYNKKELLDLGIDTNFVQDNQSCSTYGVLRGLHYQKPPHAQTKLVRVLEGAILDVVVDLRKHEPTFGRAFSLELSSANGKQLLIPKGFAHGFVVVTETADVFYKCDEYYNPASECGVFYADADLNIDWRLSAEAIILSEKDRKLPRLSESNSLF